MSHQDLPISGIPDYNIRLNLLQRFIITKFLCYSDGGKSLLKQITLSKQSKNQTYYTFKENIKVHKFYKYLNVFLDYCIIAKIPSSNFNCYSPFSNFCLRLNRDIKVGSLTYSNYYQFLPSHLSSWPPYPKPPSYPSLYTHGFMTLRVCCRTFCVEHNKLMLTSIANSHAIP